MNSSFNLNSYSENFKVAVRVRPPVDREIDPVNGFFSIVRVVDDSSLSIIEYMGVADNDQDREASLEENPSLANYHNFTFDYVYDQNSTQEEVYEHSGKPAVLSVLEGYNATLLAYGQTGTGKTYTMEGFKYDTNDPHRGMIPRAIEEIFHYIESSDSSDSKFMVRVSYVQIYNEIISDLLKFDRTSLIIREEKKKGVFVEGLSEWAVRSHSEIFGLMEKGHNYRATASTKMNDLSSRSHAVFIVIVEQMNSSSEGNEIRVGKLNIVDLAGSERVRVTGATGKRLEESKKINQSLSALGNVIAALTEAKARSHIPYRDSKLTRLLEDSLGGNCKTTMVATISPAFEAFSESHSTLKFANRAKNIRNVAKINEDVDHKALLRKYENELKRLRDVLDDKNDPGTDTYKVLELEEEKKKAEADKEAAIEALEMRSREYMSEKEEKRRLEERIKMMSSQLLVGGKKIEDHPQFAIALEEKQFALKQEYEIKLQELDKERQQIEDDKAQIDRYKQLLLRQRDIMIALTVRLNERDETILLLQDELESYDKLCKQVEENSKKNALRNEQLEKLLKVSGINIPKELETPAFDLKRTEIIPKSYLSSAEDGSTEPNRRLEIETRGFIDNDVYKPIMSLKKDIENGKFDPQNLMTTINLVIDACDTFKSSSEILKPKENQPPNSRQGLFRPRPSALDEILSIKKQETQKKV
jgi:Kinesin motor domain